MGRLLQRGSQMNGRDAASQLKNYVRKENERFDRLEFFGQLFDEPQSQLAFVKAIEQVLDERDKLLKYARIVVMQHGKEDFKEYVNAIESYLKNDLGIHK